MAAFLAASKGTSIDMDAIAKAIGRHRVPSGRIPNAGARRQPTIYSNADTDEAVAREPLSAKPAGKRAEATNKLRHPVGLRRRGLGNYLPQTPRIQRKATVPAEEARAEQEADTVADAPIEKTLTEEGYKFQELKDAAGGMESKDLSRMASDLIDALGFDLQKAVSGSPLPPP